MARRGATRHPTFLRVAMTASTAKVVREYMVERTNADHAKKCDPEDPDCPHLSNLPLARMVQAGLEIGRKRGTLDLACPGSVANSNEQTAMLEALALRIKGVAQLGGGKKQVNVALLRICDEILEYARRSPMEIIAQASCSRSELREPEEESDDTR